MFLHLIIAAALMAPGASVSSTVGPAVAMVCSIAADLHATTARERHASSGAPQPSPGRPVAPARTLHESRLTTQLRR
jgi:hypothetical protein